jgi:nucleotide-binding universal stress UspA family protein
MAAVFSRILCPIDFEQDSMDALELAGELARQNSATICLLTVIALPPAAASELPPVPLLPDGEFEASTRKGLEELARKRLADVSHEIAVASGNAAAEILNLAKQRHIELIVMGTHGRKGVAHFFLGSVAERVLRESPVPVLTIHPTLSE